MSRSRRPVSERASVEDRFGALVEALAGSEGVAVGTGKRGFGSDALQANGRIFAMISRGRIVLKLPPDRVSSLLATGHGSPFDGGKGRPMREWVVLEEAAHENLLSLAQEARAFVSRRA